MNKATSPFQIESSWYQVLEEELQQSYIQELATFVEKERASGNAIYPPKDQVFNAFYQTPFEKVKVVIVGQDPYHGPGQAHGLCFSVPKGVPFPRSLKNIYKELVDDLQVPRPQHGCLESWAQQGVLLLNATLTVSEKSPLSHHGKGWERFTDAVIAKLWDREEPIIFVLWGKNAQKKCENVIHNQKDTNHKVLIASHPSPFSARKGFFDCRHFSKINQLLSQVEKTPIKWEIFP